MIDQRAFADVCTLTGLGNSLATQTLAKAIIELGADFNLRIEKADRRIAELERQVGVLSKQRRRPK